MSTLRRETLPSSTLVGVKRNLWFTEQGKVKRANFPIDSLSLYLPLWHPELTGTPIISKDLTAYSCAVTGAVKGYYGRTFDGSDDLILVGDMGAFPTKGTLIHWIYPTSMDNYRNTFSTSATAGGSRAGIRFEEDATGIFTADVALDNANATIHTYLASGMAINTWYCVVLIWDSVANTVIGLLNDVQKFSEANTTWATTMPAVRVGVGYQLSAVRSWKGIVGDVWMWSRALSLLEASHVYTTTKWRYS
jgi:hypothetical protein